MTNNNWLISFYLIICFLFINNSVFSQISRLVNIQELDSTILVDVRYATENNFTGQKLYETNKVYLIKEAAESLVKVNQYLKKKYNLRLKIFDGYRPLSVQKKMWAIMPDERYVANPAKGSRHNRGCAVDLTLVDSLGNELDMGTPYDDFTEKSHIDYKNLPERVLQNRKILQEAMTKFNFLPMRTEWWHFDYKGWEKYPILDIKIK
ncbi:MAG: D-alanyl-D-alanine dipeptidase [Ignavibacteria bacterium]|nr:D-alanyl-D-alanine dipeptidase [Ignavibacteria bacterium]MDH7528351.1 D-alanyl-D-alanine dipeptidase [Ignavibacteria bacterium]